MNDLLIDLKQQRAELVKEMEGMLTLVETESRDLTPDEEKSYSEKETQLTHLDKKIERFEKIDSRRQQIELVTNPIVRPNITIEPNGTQKDFRNFGEYMAAVAFNPGDQRLRELRVQQMGDATTGGFAIPEQFRQDLLSVSPEQAAIRPRATVIPAGSPPEASLTIPALDQGSARNRFGGVTLYHSGESASLTETTMYLKQIKLTPHKMTGYMTASSESLRNWAACSGLIQNMLRSAMIAFEDTDFINGDGVNKALGVLQSACRVGYARAGAAAIAFADVTGMYARIKMGGSYVWLGSQTIIPQLVNIRDTGNNNLWIQSAAAGAPGTLMGIPLVFNERMPALGSAGDLCLLDLSYYLIKDGTGPLLAISEHVRFTNDEVAFRITWYTDGQAWLKEPIPLEGSTSNTVSPFVILT